MFVRIWIIGWIVWCASDAVVYKIQTENSSGRETDVPDDRITNYRRWSDWSEWSPCTRTCGGGVKSQTRQCLETSKPSSASKKKNKCFGVSKKSHVCNKNPCPKGTKDFRTVQCESYNTKSFAGVYYTWEAYYDDKSQCSLNCRPLGYEFYARLNDTVIDGTSCKLHSEAGYCVDGKCQIYGDLCLCRYAEDHGADFTITFQ